MSRGMTARLTMAIAVAGSACTGVGPFQPDGVEFRVTTETSLLETIGSQTQLELEFPDGLTTVGLETVWRSNDPAIASVDANGMVTAIGQGVATITAEAAGLSASTTITVDADNVGVARVRSDQTDPHAGNDAATVHLTVQAN